MRLAIIRIIGCSFIFYTVVTVFTGSVFSPEYAFLIVSVYIAQGAEYREVTHMLLSIITVAFRNLEGSSKLTHRWHIWRKRVISVLSGLLLMAAPRMVRRRFLKGLVGNTGYGLSASRITASMMR